MELKTSDCPCPKKECENNSNCETCRAKHKAAGNLPYCLREKTLSFDSNGVNISCTKSGEGASLIFVHGNMGSNQFFKDCPKLFKNYTVYLPDSRSHGKSDLVKRLNYDEMAEDIVCLIEHEKMVKPILFGFSDGGIIALKIAMKHPDLLGKIFPAGINLTPKGIHRKYRFLTRLVYCFTCCTKFGDKMRLMLTQPNIKAEELKAITIPTVVLYGEEDIVNLADSQAVVDNAKNAKLVIIPKENHGSYIADNEKLYNILKPLLEEEAK
ncbi:MAG: alpha/beta hydrolase [Firmicutes bacterium]|nr:alpha/beta hydrolase [Bacillota bacterium]